MLIMRTNGQAALAVRAILPTGPTLTPSACGVQPQWPTKPALNLISTDDGGVGGAALFFTLPKIFKLKYNSLLKLCNVR